MKLIIAQFQRHSLTLPMSVTFVSKGSEGLNRITPITRSPTTIAHEEEEEEADRKCSRLIASRRRKAIAVVESRGGMLRRAEAIYSIHGRANTNSCLDAQTAPVSSFFLSRSLSPPPLRKIVPFSDRGCAARPPLD